MNLPRAKPEVPKLKTVGTLVRRVPDPGRYLGTKKASLAEMDEKEKPVPVGPPWIFCQSTGDLQSVGWHRP